MDNILNITINFILFIFAILSVAVCIDTLQRLKDKEGCRRFRMLCTAYVCMLFGTIILFYSKNGSYTEIIAVQFLWFSFVALLASFISTLAYVLDGYDKTISVAVSCFCYFGLITMIIELVWGGYRIINAPTGVFFESTLSPYHMDILYIVPIAAFIVLTVKLLIGYHHNRKKKCEKRLFQITLISVIICFAGLLCEIILEHYLVYYPVFRLCLLPCLIILRNCLMISRSDRLVRDDYAEYLSDRLSIPVYITDSGLRIAFENEAAEVLASMCHEETIGMRIPGLFEIDTETEKRLADDILYDEDMNISATHRITGREYLITVKRVMDTAGGLLSSILLCYEK
ncbi:MAG: hypothetical protein K5886_07600 [Lachnospiraceae bacterium]|nr:hypothetical protein [Lachnospiraceae bacterium]